MDISIIIVNYNTKELTSACIESVIQNTSGISYEIILVDNNSTDGSKELFEKDDRIRYYYRNTNDGFGAANNYGIERSKGKYVFMLNSDTYLLNNAIYEFYKYAEENSYMGALGCFLYSKDLNHCHSYGMFLTPYKVIRNRIISPILKVFGEKISNHDTKGFNHHILDVDFVTGADIFVNRKVIESEGAFDLDFFMYCEEAEMQYRWKKNGYSSRVISMPRIVHLEGASQKNKGGFNFKKMCVMQRSQFLYMKKTTSKLAYAVFRVAFLLVRLPYIICSPSLSLRNRKDYLILLIS